MEIKRQIHRQDCSNLHSRLVGYRWKKDNENYYKYCKYQLMKWDPEEIGEAPQEKKFLKKLRKKFCL